MESHVALLVFTITAYLLMFILGALVLYWIIRLAVTHSLRSHAYWVQKQNRSVTGSIPTRV